MTAELAVERVADQRVVEQVGVAGAAGEEQLSGQGLVDGVERPVVVENGGGGGDVEAEGPFEGAGSLEEPGGPHPRVVTAAG